MINLKTTGLAAVLLASTTVGALAEIQFALSTSQNATICSSATPIKAARPRPPPSRP